MRALQAAMALCLVAGSLSAAACGLAGEEEAREQPQTTAREAASLAFAFGRQAMPDARLESIWSYWFEAPPEDGRPEEWWVDLCSPSTGLSAGFVVLSGGALLLDHDHYRDSFGSDDEDIPVAEITPSDAWVEDPIFERADVRRRCGQEMPQDWLDSPAVAAIASQRAAAWYQNASQDFDDVYLNRLVFRGGEWTVEFAPYRDSDAHTFVEVTLDASGDVLEVKPTAVLNPFAINGAVGEGHRATLSARAM
jgi:hypothetical protein